MLTVVIIILTILTYALYIIDALSIPLFLVFLILKLCNVITWSWLMVCLPLTIFAGVLLLTFILSMIYGILKVRS